MVADVETFLGTALFTRCISTGGPSMRGSGWWEHLLKTEEAYLSNSQAFMSLMFDVEGAMGR